MRLKADHLKKTLATAAAGAALLAAAGCMSGGMGMREGAGPMVQGGGMGMTARPDADMQRVLDQHAALGAQPVDVLDVPRARDQPSPADAVMAVMRAQGMSITPPPTVTTQDVMYTDAGGGQQPARIYRPAGVQGPLPVIVYYHGGGWVIADIDVYDATPRALAESARAMVVSVEYRRGPEHRFPAAHDDANAAWRWVAQNAQGWGGDPARMAVAGESAGGNLAVNVAISARDAGGLAPVHVLAVYPIANADPNLPSKVENTAAMPLRTAGLMWFGQHALRGPQDMQDPRFNLVAANLRGLPPVTIVRAQIDPLRSDGETLEAALRRAGVRVEARTFEGVTHEFFSMGRVVADARAANTYAVGRLRAAF